MVAGGGPQAAAGAPGGGRRVPRGRDGAGTGRPASSSSLTAAGARGPSPLPRFAARELSRNGVDVQPVHIQGRTIARSFLGPALVPPSGIVLGLREPPAAGPRVRNGSVCHLDVHAGGVDAMVVGSDLYHVVVRIRKLGQVAWKAIRAECAGRVGSVLELLQGRLSDHVLRVVTDPDRGLFPKPGEITLTYDLSRLGGDVQAHRRRRPGRRRHGVAGRLG